MRMRSRMRMNREASGIIGSLDTLFTHSHSSSLYSFSISFSFWIHSHSAFIFVLQDRMRMRSRMRMNREASGIIGSLITLFIFYLIETINNSEIRIRCRSLSCKPLQNISILTLNCVWSNGTGIQWSTVMEFPHSSHAKNLWGFLGATRIYIRHSESSIF
jgi:hypothetical protein